MTLHDELLKAERTTVLLDITTKEGCIVTITNVRHNGKIYTRAQDTYGEGEPLFFEGPVMPEQAANDYIDGTGNVVR